MLNLLWQILLMAAIGAVIGGFTNHIAIKMLFRPLEPKYIGSWRLPFTPGIIPRRRGDIATQLGNTVVTYLLTPEMFRNKFFNEPTRLKAEAKVNAFIEEKLFTENVTLQDWLMKAGITNVPAFVEGKVDEVIDKQIVHFKNVLSTNAIDELLPESWQSKVDMKLPEVSRYILARGEDYFASAEGAATIKNLIDNFLSSKGTLGGMIQMFLGDSDSIVSKVQKEINRFLTSDSTFEMVHNILAKEWNRLKGQSVSQLMGELDFTKVTSNIQSYAKKELAIAERLDQPLVHYWPMGATYLAEKVVPGAVEVAFEKVETNLETMIDRLNIKELVREQVNNFPLEIVERIIIGITGKELRMITILGFVLGGFIGVFQGIISYFI